MGDAELSDDERRRLGVTVCAGFDGSLSSSFAVSLGRAAGKEAEHTRSVSVSFVDPNLQDVFAVKISQDTVYGTPIFTTMGGRSSCVGETGTTKRESRVVIKEIRPLCATDKVCDGKLTYTVVIWVTKDARRRPAARRLPFLTHPHLVSVLRAGVTAFTPPLPQIHRDTTNA